MKTIKIIDLLNKIANGEEVPKYIEYIRYSDSSKNKMMVCKENIIYNLDQLEIGLNDEVEIIEEDKNIEELDMTYTHHNIDHEEIMNKINELVKEVNKLKNN